MPSYPGARADTLLGWLSHFELSAASLNKLQQNHRLAFVLDDSIFGTV